MPELLQLPVNPATMEWAIIRVPVWFHLRLPLLVCSSISIRNNSSITSNNSNYSSSNNNSNSNSSSSITLTELALLNWPPSTTLTPKVPVGSSACPLASCQNRLDSSTVQFSHFQEGSSEQFTNYYFFLTREGEEDRQKRGGGDGRKKKKKKKESNKNEERIGRKKKKTQRKKERKKEEKKKKATVICGGWSHVTRGLPEEGTS